MNHVSFIKYGQLIRDTQTLIRSLPFVPSAVYGVPRSGLIPATIIGQHFHCPVNGASGSRLATYPRRQPSDGPVLWVDDSTLSGKTIRKYFDGGYTSAIYVADPLAVDYYAVRLPTPRIFEWNMWSSIHLRRCMFDLDGILCYDPSPGERYIDLKPKYLPQVPLGAICTARIEADRAETEDWLAKWGIEYGELLMNTSPTPEARRKAKNHAKQKAAYYAESRYEIFFESEMKQAIAIRGLCPGRKVVVI